MFSVCLVYGLLFSFLRGLWFNLLLNKLMQQIDIHGPLIRYAKIAGCACAGNAGDVFPATAGYRSRYVWCMPGSLTSGFLWSRWRGFPVYRHSRRMHNPQFCVSGKRPVCIHGPTSFILFWFFCRGIVFIHLNLGDKIRSFMCVRFVMFFVR